MKLVYAISKWNNPYRARVRHLDNGRGKPLCNDTIPAFSWEHEEGKPTCINCKTLGDTVIWLVCPVCQENESACDRRPFKVTRAELASADGFILCEYCGARCIEIDTPKGK